MNCETFHYDNARTGALERIGNNAFIPPVGLPWGKYAQLNLGSPVRGAGHVPAELATPQWPARGRNTHYAVLRHVSQ
jgi:hypothetical protein